MTASQEPRGSPAGQGPASTTPASLTLPTGLWGPLQCPPSIAEGLPWLSLPSRWMESPRRGRATGEPVGRVPILCAGPSRHDPQGSKLPVDRRRSCTCLGRRGTTRTRRRTRAHPPLTEEHSAPGNRIQRGRRGGTEAREPGKAPARGGRAGQAQTGCSMDQHPGPAPPRPQLSAQEPAGIREGNEQRIS